LFELADADGGGEQPREDVIDPRGDQIVDGPAVGQQAAVAQMIEHRDQRIPETGDVGDQDRLLVAAELPPGELLDRLFEGADAAGQCHEGVGALFRAGCASSATPRVATLCQRSSAVTPHPALRAPLPEDARRRGGIPISRQHEISARNC
jgi:hypothetical protein